MLPIPILIKGLEFFISGAIVGKQVYNAVTKNPNESQKNLPKYPTKS